MKRRTYLAAGGGALATLAGGTTVADATRADVALDPDLVRGRGDPIEARRPVAPDDVEYLAESDRVRWGDTTEPFERWAERRCASVAATVVLPAVQDRFEEEVTGLGRGVRGLVFGLLVTVHHYTVLDEDGSVVADPNVAFDDLIAAAPRTVRTTVVFEGREHTRDVAVAVENGEMAEIGDLSGENGTTEGTDGGMGSAG